MVFLFDANLNNLNLITLQKIFFHSEELDFTLPNEDKTSKWVSSIIQHHSKITGDITYIFCSDDYLLKINKEYLNHDYYTDIITFDYSEKGIISGDLFISIDRVKDNAEQLNQTFESELNRVIIHGILHLIGFKDKTEEEAQLMRQKEEESMLLLAD